MEAVHYQSRGKIMHRPQCADHAHRPRMQKPARHGYVFIQRVRQYHPALAAVEDGQEVIPKVQLAENITQGEPDTLIGGINPSKNQGGILRPDQRA